jgi:hypothetical protein
MRGSRFPQRKTGPLPHFALRGFLFLCLSKSPKKLRAGGWNGGDATMRFHCGESPDQRPGGSSRAYLENLGSFWFIIVRLNMAAHKTIAAPETAKAGPDSARRGFILSAAAAAYGNLVSQGPARAVG